MKTVLSYGKMRGLRRCADHTGVFSILALDHRSVLKKALGSPDDPAETFRRITVFKQEVVATLSPESTAVLLDPSFGAGPAVADAAFPGSLGMVVSVEETGYAGEKTARISRVGEGWGVDRIKRLGVSAVKLLIYYHPDSTTAAPMRELLVQVARSCKRYDIPLFLETLSYSIDPDKPKLSTEEQRRWSVETARQLTPLGGEVYKTEFPVNVKETPNESAWSEACADLTAASTIPWVLLSAGVNYETFARQTLTACEAGASGILAGRAIWTEAPDLPPQRRRNFLKETALARMAELRQICQEHARPWTDCYEGEPTDENWYNRYPGFDMG